MPLNFTLHINMHVTTSMESLNEVCRVQFLSMNEVMLSEVKFQEELGVVRLFQEKTATVL